MQEESDPKRREGLAREAKGVGEKKNSGREPVEKKGVYMGWGREGGSMNSLRREI